MPKNIKNGVANTFQVGSLGFVTAGAFSLAPWLGLIVLGLCLGLVGYALDRQDGGTE